MMQNAQWHRSHPGSESLPVCDGRVDSAVSRPGEMGSLCLPRGFGSRLLKPCIDLGTESFDHQLAFIRVADDAAFWARIMRCQQITDDFKAIEAKQPVTMIFDGSNPGPCWRAAFRIDCLDFAAAREVTEQV